MSMLATTWVEQDGPFNPDEVQVPENNLHRRMAMLIQAVVARLVGDDELVRANLNWYPSDNGNAVAPDVMVFAERAMETDASSYQQGADGPRPIAVVEVPSDSDMFTSFHVKQARYHRLGTVSYVAEPRGELSVTRFAPDNDEPRSWLGRPCPELGGLVFKIDDDRLVIWLPDGTVVGSVDELLAIREAAAESAEARAETAEALVERLAARLRDAGLDAHG